MTGAPLAGRGQRPAALGAGVAAAALFAWWAVEEGGTSPGSLYPGALLLLAALAVLAGGVAWTRLPRAARLALGALAAFTAWSFLSIAWADARGDAWDAANRALVYLTVFALFAALPWSAAEAVGALVAFVLATTVAGIWALGEAIAGSTAALADGRLAGPVGYENATAALMLAAFWPAVVLAARRSAAPPLRGLLLATAGFLLAIAVLTQSRGSLLAGAVALVLAVALSRERPRLLVVLSAVTLTTLASLPALLDVYAGGGTQQALIRAAVAMTLSSALLLTAGLASPRLDRRRDAATAPRLPLRSLAAAAAVVLAAVVWAQAGETRLAGGAGSGRYDFWRVAANQLARDPLKGAGAGNFAHDYVRERRRREEPLHPHSIVLGTLGQTGIVGGALLTGFLVAAFAGIRRVRALGEEPSAVALAALVSAAAWLAQASIDWLWELPALTAPAVALLGLVAGLGLSPAARGAPAPRRRLANAATVGVLAGAAAASYALPALAARHVERAVSLWDEDARAASRALDRARTLDPLSDRPDVVAGALAHRAEETARARRAFRRALGRDASNWYAHAELALLELGEGRRASAAARLALANRLNPLEPAIAAAADAVRRGRPVPTWVEERLSSMPIPGPLGRRSVDCGPVFGLRAACVGEATG